MATDEFEAQDGFDLSAIYEKNYHKKLNLVTNAERKSPGDAAFEPTGMKGCCNIEWFKGIKEDLTERLPLYCDDWDLRDADLLKITSATFFAFFTSIMPAMCFGDTLSEATDGEYGIPEVLAASRYIAQPIFRPNYFHHLEPPFCCIVRVHPSSPIPFLSKIAGIMGIVYSIFAGQGLIIIGVTGPVAFFVTTIVTLCDTIEAPFLQFMGWVCVWCGLMHVVVAASGATVLVQRVTNFSGEIFGFFISVAYIFLGLKGLLELFMSPPRSDDDDDDDDGAGPHSPTGRRGAAFASLCLAVLMYEMAISFHHARSWRILSLGVRDFVTQFGMVGGICACTMLSYTPVFKDDQMDLERLDVEGTLGSGVSVVPLFGGGIQAWQIVFATLPAAMLLVLFFFDHNVSSLLSQSPRFNLQKPPSFHYDYAVLGGILVLCGVIGVPPGNGLIPQAPLHVRALATIEAVPVDEYGNEIVSSSPGGGLKDGPSGGGGGSGGSGSAAGGEKTMEVYRRVEEKRWSNLLQSALCLASFGCFSVLSMLPRAVLFGTFLYMGVSGFDGNDLFERACCLFMDPSHRPDFSWARSTNVRLFNSSVSTLFFSFSF